MSEKIKLSVAVEGDIYKRLKYKTFDEGLTGQQIVEEALKQYLKPEEAPEEQTIEASIRSVRKGVQQLLSEGDPVAIEALAVAVRAIVRMKHNNGQHEKEKKIA